MSQEQILLARQQARRLRYVTSQLTWGFPGMTRSPIGVMLLLPHLIEWIPDGFRMSMGFGPFFISFLVLGLGCIVAKYVLLDYYTRRFGRVLPSDEQSSPLVWLRFILVLAAAFGFAVFAYLRQAPFYSPGLLLGLYYLTTWLRSDGLRFHRGLAAGLALTLSLLPLWHLFTVPEVVEIVKALFAVELLLGGICDHVLLVRSFRELAKGIHEHAVPRAC